MNALYKTAPRGRLLLRGAAAVAAIALATSGGVAASVTVWPGNNGSTVVVLVQARDTNLTGVWVSPAGDKFEIAMNAGKVQMTATGALKGRISGNFDGAAFAGAYQATEGSPPDRGVIRFFLTQDGKLEGSWHSLVNGKQGTWVLTKQ